MALTAQQEQALAGALKGVTITSFGAGSGTTTNRTSNPNVVAKPPAAPASGGFLGKVENVGKEAFNIGKSVAKTGASFVKNTGVDLYQEAEGSTVNLAKQAFNVQSITKNQNQLSNKQDQLIRDYAAGKVSKSDYIAKLNDMTAEFQDLSKQSQKISQDKSAFQRGLDVVDLGISVLSSGSLKLASIAGKQELKTLVTKGTEDVFNANANQLEKAVARLPAVRDIFKRDILTSAKQLPGEAPNSFLTRNAKQIAVGLMLKRPIFYQTNIGLAQDAYKQMLDGKNGKAAQDAAWVAVQAVSGGPLGWFFRQSGRIGSGVKTLALGKGSFIDELSKLHGDYSPAQISNYLTDLKTSDPAKFAEAEKTMRIMQEVNLRMADDDPTHAAEAVMNHYYANAIDPSELTPAQLIEDMGKWARGDEIVQGVEKRLNAKGIGQPGSLVAIRFDSKVKNGIGNEILKAGDDIEVRLSALNRMADAPATGWSNSRILMSKLEQAIQLPGKEAAKAIKEIPTASRSIAVGKDGITVAEAKELDELGYTVAEAWGGRQTPAVAYEDTRKLVSAVTHGDKELFDESVAPVPVLSSIAYGLRKAGFTPETNNKVAFGELSKSLVDNLEEAGIANQIGLDGPDKLTGGKVMLSRLEEYITQQKPNRYLNALTGFKSQQSALQDIRQMNVDEIMQALPGTSRLQAKAIGDAVVDAYTKVPLEFRGLGVKASDYMFKVPGFKTYNRIQSALRYTYNPFFRAQEVIETKTLSHLKANNLVWQQPKAELDRVATLLDDSKIFSNSYTGEATQDLSIGRIHPNLVKTQRRDLSGLALDIAGKRGITVEDMITDHSDELADALKVVVQYPSKGALNSPLARTLNIAFFPMRYNLKVAALAAGEIAKLPPSIQTAVIHSYFKFNDFLKSNEGIAWQADNADVIQLFGYFSVTGNINAVYKLLTNHQVNAVGDLGALGGLPFGFISQILDAEGIINLNTPYVDPKTGSVLPDYVPATAKAKAATALQGLLNTMFTYPGRIIGAPGKAEELRKLTGVVVPTEGNDYTKVDRSADLTPLQQRMRQVLQDPTQDNVDSLYTAPAPGMFNWYTIPPKFVVPDTVDVLSKTEVAARKAAAKSTRAPKVKAKALPIPAQGQVTIP